MGSAVEALLECSTGSVSYVVISSGGVGGVAEDLRAVARDDLSFDCDHLTLQMPRSTFDAMLPLKSGDWPSKASSQFST